MEDYYGLGVLGLALVLWINYLMAREFQRAAEAKGFTEKKYLWICFFLGLPGYLLVIALPNKNSGVALPNNAASLPDEIPTL